VTLNILALITIYVCLSYEEISSKSIILAGEVSEIWLIWHGMTLKL